MDQDYRRAANITVILCGIGIAAWLFLKYAFGAVLPFLSAALLGAVISPLASGISKATKIPKKLCSGILVILFFLALSSLFGFVCSKLIDELGDLLLRLEQEPALVTDPLDRISAAFSEVGTRFGIFKKISESAIWQELGLDLMQLLSDALRSALGRLSAAAVGMAAKLPTALLSTAVFLISAFYFASDGKAIGRSLSSFLPEKWQRKLPFLGTRLKNALFGYLKAYLLIMLLTFLEVFIGLSILRVGYAFLLALLIAAVDILPILGTGTVLVPWGIFSLMNGEVRLGTGLLILYAVSLILRQLAEPKIVGSSLGLHPLATLASIYLGLRFLGFAGLILGPVVALLLQNLLFKGESFGSVAVSTEQKQMK